MTDAIETTTEELATALATFERNRASLFRSDGAPKFTEQEHADRLKVFTETLHGVAERVDTAVDAELAAIRKLEEAEHADPVSYLTPAELATANARALFVRENCEPLTLPQLRTRLRGIVAVGEGRPDRVQAFLWSRYAAQRLAGEAERARAEHRGTVPPQLRDDLERVEIEIAQLVAVVTPQAAISKTEAARRMKRARDARSATLQRVHEADGTRERMLAQLAARYGGF